MVLLFVLVSLHLALGAPCSTLTDVDENATATAVGFTCGQRGVICVDDSGTCHVTYVSGNHSISSWENNPCIGLVNFSFPMLRTMNISGDFIL